MARVTGSIGSGQEQQFDRHKAFALARFATTARDVEREPARCIAASLCFIGCGEELAHDVKHSRVGCEVGARSAADGALVDEHEAVERVEPAGVFEGEIVQLFIRIRSFIRSSTETVTHCLGENVGDER